MTGNNPKKCRFCLKLIYDNAFDVIGEITKQMLNGLLLKLDLDDGTKYVMCHECAAKLQNALDFKTLCLDTENKLLPFMVSGGSDGLELRKESVADSFGGQICRFCTKVVEGGGYTYLQGKKENIFMVDMVLKHIPELNLSATEELLTCETCRGSLQCLVGFIRTSLDAEEKIKENMDEEKFTASYGNASITKLEEFERVIVKNEIKCEDHMEMDKPEITVKTEISEMKSDQNECERLQNTSSSPLILGNMEQFGKCPPNNLDQSNQENISEIMYNCQMCSYKTKYEHYFKKHGIIHKKPSDVKMYKCDKCTYRAKLAGNLKKHMLIHQDPLEVPMYGCDMCQFETKRKGTLIKHMRVHQDLSKIPVYKCETCSFESKHKHSLERHVLIHQDPSELTVYKCQSCQYVTKHKSHLNAHILVHKSPSELKMFCCEMCTFQTKRRKALNKHLLTH